METNQAIENYIKKLLEESTPETPIWNVEILKGRKPSWNYIDGCMLSSILEFYKVRHEKSYLDFVIKYTDYFVQNDGTIKTYEPTNYSLDDLSESRILFDLWEFTKEDKYLKAIQYTYSQIKTNPRTYEGNFWHKPRHPNQVWLDGLFMAQVFYMQYETQFNRFKNYPDIKKQYELVRLHMYNKDTKLYYHGYDASKEAFWCDRQTGLSKSHWLRAMGWYIISLVEILSIIDKKHEDFKFYKGLFIEALDGILLYQDMETKLFYQVIDQMDRKGNYVETSGSSMIAYALLKGNRIGILSKEYGEKGLEVFNGICKKYLTIVDGKINLGGICLLAGLGNALFRDGSFEYYISEPVVENDAKGVGPFIMAYIETLRK